MKIPRFGKFITCIALSLALAVACPSLGIQSEAASGSFNFYNNLYPVSVYVSDNQEYVVELSFPGTITLDFSGDALFSGEFIVSVPDMTGFNYWYSDPCIVVHGREYPMTFVMNYSGYFSFAAVVDSYPVSVLSCTFKVKLHLQSVSAPSASSSGSVSGYTSYDHLYYTQGETLTSPYLGAKGDIDLKAYLKNSSTYSNYGDVKGSFSLPTLWTKSNTDTKYKGRVDHHINTNSSMTGIVRHFQGVFTASVSFYASKVDYPSETVQVNDSAGNALQQQGNVLQQQGNALQEQNNQLQQQANQLQQNAIDSANQNADNIMNGYDNSAMGSANDKISGSLGDYGSVEDEAFNQASGTLDGYDITKHLTFGSGLISGLSFVKSFANSFFTASGEMQTGVYVLFTMAFFSIISGLWRFWKG